MKVGAQTSPKFKRLVRGLRESGECGPVSPELVATGILESLWLLTAQHYKDGAIGKAQNIDIAESINWYGDADAFIKMMTESGWLDESDDHRLVVHDWHEHCPTFVKGVMQRTSTEFASKCVTKSMTKLNTKSKTKTTPISSQLPSLVKPIKTKAKKEISESTLESFEFWWKAALKLKRSEDDKASIRKKYAECIESGFTEEDMLQWLDLYAKKNFGKTESTGKTGIRKDLNPINVKDWLQNGVQGPEQRKDPKSFEERVKANLAKLDLSEYEDGPEYIPQPQEEKDQFPF